MDRRVKTWTGRILLCTNKGWNQRRSWELGPWVTGVDTTVCGEGGRNPVGGRGNKENLCLEVAEVESQEQSSTAGNLKASESQVLQCACDTG